MSRKPRPGDLVEVRTKEEILATLDRNGNLRGLPFMPEMFQHCGKRLRVYKRAHKSCDTAKNHGTGRWLGDAVLLEGIRCGGEAHGGCDAECLIFWWHEWLKEVPEPGAVRSDLPAPGNAPGCTEQDVAAATVQPESTPAEPVYACQATLLHQASTYLPWWDLRQYAQDYLSGNVGLWNLISGFIYISFYHFSKLPLIHNVLVSTYDTFQSLVGGVKFPRKRGRIPAGQKTPAGTLGLQPGEMARVKSYEDILSTVNDENKNQGLYFDAELVPYCGKTYRVAKRISRVIDERTGKMIQFKNASIMLENVVCQGRYSNNRMFCPRAMPCFWREIWLERADGQPAGSQSVQTAASLTVSLQPPAPR